MAIDSLSDALQALEVGRSRSENWAQDPFKGTYTSLPNRAHTFVRITLYDSRRRRVSALHLVVLHTLMALPVVMKHTAIVRHGVAGTAGPRLPRLRFADMCKCCIIGGHAAI